MGFRNVWKTPQMQNLAIGWTIPPDFNVRF